MLFTLVVILYGENSNIERLYRMYVVLCSKLPFTFKIAR